MVENDVAINGALVRDAPRSKRPKETDPDIWEIIREMIAMDFQTLAIMQELDAEAAGTLFVAPEVVDVTRDVKLGLKHERMQIRAAVIGNEREFIVEFLMDPKTREIVGAEYKDPNADVRLPSTGASVDPSNAGVRESARDWKDVLRSLGNRSRITDQVRPELRPFVARTSQSGPALRASAVRRQQVPLDTMRGSTVAVSKMSSGLSGISFSCAPTRRPISATGQSVLAALIGSSELPDTARSPWTFSNAARGVGAIALPAD
ncbi:hypothetical protein ACU8M5_10440 [Rhizobium leguminosarum]